jgi:hypothetical protein
MLGVIDGIQSINPCSAAYVVSYRGRQPLSGVNVIVTLTHTTSLSSGASSLIQGHIGGLHSNSHGE